MFKKFNQFRRRLAGKIVTYYYSRLYTKAKEKADERHKKENETIYVIDHFIKGQTLSVINRKEFRYIKHSAQKLHKNEAFWSPYYNTDMLRKQAWYHTADGSGNKGLTAQEAEIRRLAFIRSGLKKARLLEQ